MPLHAQCHYDVAYVVGHVSTGRSSMKLSAQAMNAALSDFKSLMFGVAKVSLYESYLAAKWMSAHGKYPNPSISDTDEAVSAMFEVLP